MTSKIFIAVWSFFLGLLAMALIVRAGIAAEWIVGGMCK